MFRVITLIFNYFKYRYGIVNQKTDTTNKKITKTMRCHILFRQILLLWIKSNICTMFYQFHKGTYYLGIYFLSFGDFFLC